MALKKHKTIVESLQYVADHPEHGVDATLDTPAWELVARTLFDIANNPEPRVRGSIARSVRASRMITDRLVGRRKAGTHPARQTTDTIEFVDLTGGELE